MTRKPSPDLHPEASLIRDELPPDSPGHQALDAIAMEEKGELELPPVPEDLREQWKDRYGEASEPRPATPEAQQSSTPWWQMLGLGSVALLALFFIIRQGGPSAPLPDSDDPFQNPALMRGEAIFTPASDTPVYLIPSATISPEEMRKIHQSGEIIAVTDQNQAMELLEKRGHTNAVLLDAATGMLFPFPGKPGDEVQLISDPASTDIYDLAEALDAYLQP